MLDPGDGPLKYVPKEPEMLNESEEEENSQDEALSTTPTDSRLDK